jgi:hypothetical protein
MFEFLSGLFIVGIVGFSIFYWLIIIACIGIMFFTLLFAIGYLSKTIIMNS